ncbi:helix-turn-helix domain-containing protein [Candidatus Margulisiibacteriota bacterium]
MRSQFYSNEKFKGYNFCYQIPKPHYPIKTFGQRLKKVRIEAKFNVKQLSRLTGVAESTISRYEKENIPPSNKAVNKLSKTLNVSSFYLLYGNKKYKFKSFGEKIKIHRIQKMLSRMEIAKRIGVSAGTIGAWERNIDIPNNSRPFKKFIKIIGMSKIKKLSM